MKTKDEITAGMRDPKRNQYLLMPVKDLRKEIRALESTCQAIIGSPSPRHDALLLDSHHRLKFARAAMMIRGEVE